MVECKVECLHRKQCDAINNPCWHHTKVMSELQQAQATIAALRGALEEIRNMDEIELMDESHMVADKALSTTAGAELLEKIGQLERENKALRCCDNCEHMIWQHDDRGCKLTPQDEYGYYDYNFDCTPCDDSASFKDWQLAERLVSK